MVWQPPLKPTLLQLSCKRRTPWQALNPSLHKRPIRSSRMRMLPRMRPKRLLAAMITSLPACPEPAARRPRARSSSRQSRCPLLLSSRRLKRRRLRGPVRPRRPSRLPMLTRRHPMRRKLPRQARRLRRQLSQRAFLLQLRLLQSRLQRRASLSFPCTASITGTTASTSLLRPPLRRRASSLLGGPASPLPGLLPIPVMPSSASTTGIRETTTTRRAQLACFPWLEWRRRWLLL